MSDLPVTQEELEAAYKAAGYAKVGISLPDAMSTPLRRVALLLGARILRRPKRARVDFKRIAAGDTED